MAEKRMVVSFRAISWGRACYTTEEGTQVLDDHAEFEGLSVSACADNDLDISQDRGRSTMIAKLEIGPFYLLEQRLAKPNPFAFEVDRWRATWPL